MEYFYKHLNFYIPLVFLFIASFAQAQTNIELTMVGDIGLNNSNKAPLATHINYYDSRVSYSSLGNNIAPYLTGDLVFGNLETVVSDIPLESPKEKAYKFQSHPNGVRHLVGTLGFNVLSLANNHSADYLYSGLRSTYNWMSLLAQEQPLVFHGLGTQSEIVQPSEFSVKGVRGAFLAIGADSFGLNNAPARSNRIGSLNYHQRSMVRASLENLRKTNADLKIISVHYGREKQVHLDSGQQENYRNLLDTSGADIIIGHHPHVVRPVEIYKGKLIIYSLGNFMLLGAANIDGRELGYDYGAIAKARLNVTNGQVKFESLELIPIQGTHFNPHVLSTEEASRKIEFLNRLSTSELGNNAVHFQPTNYSGVWLNPNK